MKYLGFLLSMTGCGFVTTAQLDDRQAQYDLDGDGVIGLGGTDCDDTNATVFPGAAEVCD